MLAGQRVVLFVAWLSWSRFRVVVPLRDRTMPSVIAALDATFRRLGGAPTFALTDNEKTVTDRQIAGIAVRNPQIVAAGHYHGLTIATCVPADPESKGGSESSVKLAKADLVPTDHNLLADYESCKQLVAACDAFMDTVNGRVHRATAQRPTDRLESGDLPARPVQLDITRGPPVRSRLRRGETGQGTVVALLTPLRHVRRVQALPTQQRATFRSALRQGIVRVEVRSLLSRP